ncbi:MAG TPA: glycoside hydrolase family 71/99-like protein [Bryobacteraceae bacterium]|nr:glycoside hydrolase family 71/99-like protein [Bryobacteraceae bacterium]
MKRAAFLLVLCVAAAPAADRVDPSTLDNKVLIGYQGWFTCPQDGSGRWTHWSRGVPTPETLTVELFPDVSELTPEERCDLPGMTIGGKPAYVFSSRNAKTVSRHFRWMQQYGLDGVLVQRFVGSIRGKHADGDVVLKNIMAAAKESGRTFAIEYDISGGNPDTFAQALKDDWVYLVDELKVTSQPNYQHHNGKPVLSIWGMGLNDRGHPPADAKVAEDLIEWFKSKAPEKYQVTYMGGTPARWGTLSRDSWQDPAWAGVYASMDVIQPWNVGRYGTLEAVDQWKKDVLIPDVQLTAKNHQMYMPVVFPGFSWSNLKHNSRPNQIPRLRGEFLWRQAYNAKMAGAKMLKIAMFDEVDEGTAILKVVSHRKQAPDQGFWLTLDADGADLPSDWYLRLAGQITRMFHGEIQPDPKLPAHPGK